MGPMYFNKLTATSENIPVLNTHFSKKKKKQKTILQLHKTQKHINPYPTNRFCPENVVSIFCLLHIIALQIRFFMEANNMFPDQTAPMGAV